MNLFRHTASVVHPVLAVPRSPILLAHGLMGFDTMSLGLIALDYWRGVKKHLEGAGATVYISRVPPTSGIDTRAKILHNTVQEIYQKHQQRVNIVAHSMGGLDSRYAISMLDAHKEIGSLTTIGTPHRGTAFADWSWTIPGSRVLEAILRTSGIRTEAFFQLTTTHLAEFNKTVVDHDNVRYYSIGCAKARNEIRLSFRIPYDIILREEGQNDGLVSVLSSQWGYFFNMYEADHLDQIGWTRRWDCLQMYSDISGFLAQQGH